MSRSIIARCARGESERLGSGVFSRKSGGMLPEDNRGALHGVDIVSVMMVGSEMKSAHAPSLRGRNLPGLPTYIDKAPRAVVSAAELKHEMLLRALK